MSLRENARATSLAGHRSSGTIYLTSADDLEDHPALLPYAHYIAQAWDELDDLSGVLCVDSRPTVYLFERNSFDLETKRTCHRYVWNQGLAPLLIFLTRTQVDVYSAATVPVEDAVDGLFARDDLPNLIPTVHNLADALECAKFIRSIETGQFFQDHAKFFPTDETVDRCLVENLTVTANRLAATSKTWDLPRAFALLGRVLFVSFLEARKFIKTDWYPAGTIRLLDLLTKGTATDRKRRLYDEFFERLRVEFNGTMFDSELAAEKRRVDAKHLDILAAFLSGDDMRTGQMKLSFWAYDFRVIPVETISAIYEQFLNADLEKQRSDGAYYTPRHLAETALHVALEGRFQDSAKWKILDPACGSGIFLVGMFNLISEQWLRENARRQKKTKAKELLEILRTQIRGIDKNPEACRIAAFSLYLALFEKLRPTDVDEFKANVRHDRFLPPLVQNGEQESAESAVIMCCDYLKDDRLERDFDLVIGNPPWESRVDKQIALHFTRRTPHHLRPGGIGCLILPTTILVNLHGALDAEWFRTMTVERIVQLADFRRLLFNATHACFIIRYKNDTPSIDDDVRYETPKLNRFDRRRGIFVIEHDDHKLVPLTEIISSGERDRLQSLWSRKFWGTPRDERFLRRLDALPKLDELVGPPGSGKRWTGGVGFKPQYDGASSGTPQPLSPWKLTDAFIENDNAFPSIVLLLDDCSTLRDCLSTSHLRKRDKVFRASLAELHRKPNDSIFQPPMVIYSEGFTKFAFCNHLVRFRNSLRSISGKQIDEDLLRFLTVVLASRMMQYISFHSGSSNGIGRDKLHLYESLALPFLLPTDECAVGDAAEIIIGTAEVHRSLERSTSGMADDQRARAIADALAELEPLVFSYYRVNDSEKILIEDTLSIFRKSICRSNLDGDVPGLRFPEGGDRKQFADTLCQTLSRMAKNDKLGIRAEGMASKELNLILLTVYFGGQKAAYREVGGEPELWATLERLRTAAEHSQGVFSYLRGFTYFDHDRLHILKPATLRNWCRTAALNDADAIFEYLNRQGIQ